MNKKLKQVINQIIKEELNIATLDGTSTSATSTQKTTAKKALDKGESVNFRKKGDNIDEMARIATKVKVGDEKAFAQALSKFEGTWVGSMLKAVQAAPEGLTQPEMVQAAGKKQQQDINPYVRKLQATGALALGDLAQPKKEKPASVPGALGRRPTEAGIQKKAAAELMQALKANPKTQPTEDQIKILGNETVEKIKALMAAGGPRRGRPMSESGELDEMARIATKVKIGDAKAFQAAKDKFKGTWVGSMLAALEGAKEGLTQPELVQAAGKKQQQDINPYVRKLQATGALVLGDLAQPKKEKPVSVPGALGRRPTEDGIKKKASAILMKTFLENPKYKPKKELISLLGAEEIAKIKQIAASGGPKKGRPMAAPKELEEMARIPVLYQVANKSKLADLGKLGQSAKVQGIIDYIESEGPQKIIDIAVNKFNTRQQAINPIVQAMVDAGVLSAVEGSGKATPQYKADGTLKQTTQQKRAAKPDAEDFFVGNHNALGSDDNEEQVEFSFTGNGEERPLSDDEFAEKDPEIDVAKLEKSKSMSSLTDQDYQDLMDYLKYSEQLSRLKSSINKNKKVKRGGDDLTATTGDRDQDRIYDLKDTIDAKLADLIANSEFLKRRIAKEKGQEYIPPVVDDIDNELSGVEDDEELDEVFLNESTINRFKQLANI